MDELLLNADALRKEGKNEEALKVLNKVFWLDPNCGQCFAFRSGVLGNLGRFKEGFADGDIGVRKSVKPRDKAFAAYNMGFNLEGLKRTSEALSAYEDCIRFDATFPMCYFGKGKALNSIGDYSQALKALDTATSLHPEHGPSWAYKAIAKAALGKGIEAAADGFIAIKFAPTDPRSYMARAQGYGTFGAYEAMLADAKKALELDPNRPGVHFLLGQALLKLKRSEEAAIEFDLETDRKAVSRFLHPERNLDTRLFNCGDESTNIQTPDNFNVEGFNDCKERVLKALTETATPAQPKPAPKLNFPIPGVPERKVSNK